MDKMPGVGGLRDVVIRNVKATDAGIGEKKLGMDGCCSITGIPNHPVENVTLENISIKYKGGEIGWDPQRKVPEVENSYPEQNMFGVLPAYGMFLRHVRGLEIKNFQVDFEANEQRPVMVAVDVDGLKITDFKARAADLFIFFSGMKEWVMVDRYLIHDITLQGMLFFAIACDGGFLRVGGWKCGC
jgi:hypothetical protein